MDNLISGLQKDLLDDDIKTSNLLRKASVLASNLNLEDFEKWIFSELEGYKDYNEIPDYRNINGELYVVDREMNWEPVVFEDPKLQELSSSRKIPESLDLIEKMIDSDKHPGLKVPGFNKSLKSLLTRPDQEFIFLPNMPPINTIPNTVRNTLLKWILQLRKDGIINNEEAFSEKEQNKLSSQTYNIENYINFEKVNKSQIQQGRKNVIHSNNLSEEETKYLKSFITKFEDLIQGTELEDSRQSLVLDEINSLKKELNSGELKKSFLKKSLNATKEILLGASGNLLAEGLSYKIIEMLKYFGLN